MSDLVLKDFKGLHTSTDPRDIKSVEFSDGQNFWIDRGSVAKRAGREKVNTTRLNGAIQGIAYMGYPRRPQPEWDESPDITEGEIIIAAGGYVYTGRQ